ncbi:hypothetical protein J6590_028142 [Homalodisca vitripennis]|nr:hypothetical protein J6590_028142 [Homalodisca vitripennis]
MTKYRHSRNCNTQKYNTYGIFQVPMEENQGVPIVPPERTGLLPISVKAVVKQYAKNTRAQRNIGVMNVWHKNTMRKTVTKSHCAKELIHNINFVCNKIAL